MRSLRSPLFSSFSCGLFLSALLKTNTSPLSPFLFCSASFPPICCIPTTRSKSVSLRSADGRCSLGLPWILVNLLGSLAVPHFRFLFEGLSFSSFLSLGVGCEHLLSSPKKPPVRSFLILYFLTDPLLLPVLLKLDTVQGWAESTIPPLPLAEFLSWFFKVLYNTMAFPLLIFRYFAVSWSQFSFCGLCNSSSICLTPAFRCFRCAPFFYHTGFSCLLRSPLPSFTSCSVGDYKKLLRIFPFSVRRNSSGFCLLLPFSALFSGRPLLAGRSNGFVPLPRPPPCLFFFTRFLFLELITKAHVLFFSDVFLVRPLPPLGLFL